jgi:SAM-dependent methyltransferase
MKIRDSGMPEEDTWASFFDPELTLRQLGFVFEREDVVDFGCGYGTFSVAAAQLTTGTVYALDIDPQMVAATGAKAQRHDLGNVRPIERDFVSLGTGLPTGSVAYAMLFNVLHAEDATGLLREAFRVLRDQGIVAIMHWVYDATTPRGPALSIRPRPEQCLAWASEVGFVPDASVIALPPYHYGVLARKPEQKLRAAT